MCFQEKNHFKKTLVVQHVVAHFVRSSNMKVNRLN
jgi:hypothetical protein